MDTKSKFMYPGLVEGYILKEFHKNLKWMFMEYELPFPFANRDYTTLAYYEYLPEEKFAIIVNTSGENPFAPPPKKGVIRGEISK